MCNDETKTDDDNDDGTQKKKYTAILCATVKNEEDKQ